MYLFFLEGKEIADLYSEEHDHDKVFNSYLMTMESLAKLAKDVNIRDLISRQCEGCFQEEADEYCKGIVAEAKESLEKVQEETRKRRDEIIKSDFSVEEIAEKIKDLYWWREKKRKAVSDWELKMISRVLINQVVSSAIGEWRELPLETGEPYE